jgi:hypothetical protein
MFWPGEGGTLAAQTIHVVVSNPKATWDYVVDVAQIVGAGGAIVAIWFAWRSLRESTAVRREALAERRLDRAEARREALAQIAVLLRGMDEAGRNGHYMTLVDYRSRVAVVLASHLLAGELPGVERAADGSLYTGGSWQKDNANAATLAFTEADAELANASELVRELSDRLTEERPPLLRRWRNALPWGAGR